MAFKKLAVTTTLETMQESIRQRTSTLSPQDSGIINEQMDRICHEAIVQVRALYGKFLDSFYQTDVTVTESGNLIDISTYDIANLLDVTLYDSTYGEVPILEQKQFNHNKIYRASDTKALFARISNILATDNKLQIQTHRGSAVATPGTLTFTYTRNPKKTVKSDTDRLLDLPEHLIPLATAVATISAYQIAKKTPPADVTALVIGQVQAFGAQVGVKLSPAQN